MKPQASQKTMQRPESKSDPLLEKPAPSTAKSVDLKKGDNGPVPTFWRWFFRGERGVVGWKKLVDRWLLLHVGVGAAAGWALSMPLTEAARSVLLPLAGVLVGISFAWVGSAQAVMQTPEIDRLAEHGGGVENYVYTFQSAILAILVTLVLWGFAGLGVFDRPCPWACPSWLYRATIGVLFFFVSFTIRECWHVVLNAQMLLLSQRQIARMLADKDSEGRS